MASFFTFETSCTGPRLRFYALKQCFSTDGSRPGNGSWKIYSGSWNFFQYCIDGPIKKCSIKKANIYLNMYILNTLGPFFLEGGE